MCRNMSGFDFHVFCLTKLCRICGGRAQNSMADLQQKSPKLCKNYVEQILYTFGIDITEDLKDIHPTCICYLCYRRLNNETTFSGESFKHLWEPHQRVGECKVCSLFNQQSKGGRPKKVKRGRPAAKKQLHETNQDINSVLSEDGKSHLLEQGRQSPSYIWPDNFVPIL